MAEIFKARHFLAFAIHSLVQVIDDVVAIPEPNQIKIEFVADGLDESDQVLVFLRCAIEIALFINQPGDGRVRPETVAQFFRPQPRSSNEIGPPMIVRLGFILLPFL